MHILLLTDGIFPHAMGGMQKHSYYLAKYLAKKKVKVILYHCTGDHQSLENDGADTTVFTEEELQCIDFRYFQFPKIDSLPGHYVRENKAYSSLIYEDVKRELSQVDLIYAQGYTGWRFIQERLAGKVERPILVNFHGNNMFYKAYSFTASLQNMLLKPTAKWMCQHADYVVSLGGKLTETIQQIPVSSRQILETPIGIEVSWLKADISQKTDETTRFVFVGRYDKVKAIEELNGAIQNLIRDQENFEFHFIGPIPEAKQIANEKVSYHGAIHEQEKIQEQLRKCDILVCASHSEGMPTVILEAMASGLAIIGTNVGAIPEQIEGNGWLIETNAIPVLTEALKTACSADKELMDAHKCRSLELIREKFLWEKTIELTIEQFTEIVKG